MPGIFGGFANDEQTVDVLTDRFIGLWPGSRMLRSSRAALGGHAFEPSEALFSLSAGSWLAIDGEYSLYGQAAKEGPSTVFQMREDAFELSSSHVGNIALIDVEKRTAHLATDWTATFPLYYWHSGSVFLFSSLLRPLAAAVAAERDDVGVLAFLTQAITYNGRTQFKGISRLLPGQIVTYAHGAVRIEEKSAAWVSIQPHRSANVERAWEGINSTLEALPAATALMMSAGWDSRTLFAALRERRGKNSLCYSHGDVGSREIRIVEALCRTRKVPLYLEPIDDRVWNPEMLSDHFGRTENATFPHWFRAGAVLREAGADCVTAGVYGEVLGGHYGMSMLLDNRRRAASVAKSLFGVTATDSLAIAVQLLARVPLVTGLWYLKRDCRDSLGGPESNATNQNDVAASIERLRARGVTSVDQLVEAFITEHRGSQYINAQIRSCRSSLDVALPFASRELLAFGGSIPLEEKIHNKLNRAILRAYAPDLLRQPLAATLVSAGAPLAVQEASRVVRRLYEHGLSTGNMRVDRRMGWVNFSFLDNGLAFHRVIDSLECDFWDLDALRDRANRAGSPEMFPVLHQLYDQLSKIVSMDLMLRH